MMGNNKGKENTFNKMELSEQAYGKEENENVGWTREIEIIYAF